VRLPEQRAFLVWCYANNEWPQLDDGKRTKPSTTHNQMLFRAVIVVETPQSSNQTRWEQLQRYWESEGRHDAPMPRQLLDLGADAYCDNGWTSFYRSYRTLARKDESGVSDPRVLSCES
jgi:hypothetical protein